MRQGADGARHLCLALALSANAQLSAIHTYLPQGTAIGSELEGGHRPMEYGQLHVRRGVVS
jgi:hypothetical protein